MKPLSILGHALILTISFQLTACMKSSSVPIEQRPSMWASSIDQQNNFYKVSDFVYRSEQPHTELLAELKQNKIDKVINLRSSNSDPLVFKDSHFQLVHIPINTWSINREDLLRVMQEIQVAQKQHQKVLIHCYHGSDRTGASIAMYRIIFENWSTQDALNEMKHGGYGFHPIWLNIENIFTAENIKWIRNQLTNPS